MKQMLGQLAALLVTLAMVLSLTACRGEKKDVPEAPVENTVEDTAEDALEQTEEAGAGLADASGDGADLDS